ncbi:MAG: hypothetical protein K2I81_02420 [Alphaproteobacteria bacterium]|nr:hypothetical protein [Alphaproteobacteria bacterium]
MKKQILSAIMAAVVITGGAYADHRHGPRHECWRDSEYDDHWAYYYCGDQAAKCDGKKSKSHDTVFWQYHGDHFIFQTEPHDTYWCCGGTTESEGKYVKSAHWITNTTTERVSIYGGTCNKLIQTDACGGQHIIECTEPDTCAPGQLLRNRECIKPCGADEAFESSTSNTCISCEANLYQGPSLDRQVCIKCDQTSEFFNRETKKCVKKSSLEQYSKQTMKECWRCPQSFYADCIKEMKKPSDQRGFAINNWQEIKRKCHLK